MTPTPTPDSSIKGTKANKARLEEYISVALGWEVEWGDKDKAKRSRDESSL